MTNKIDFSITNAYHGSQFRIEEFSEDFIGRGNDQLGSGFYCTTGETVARGYSEEDSQKTILFGSDNISPTLHTLKLSIKNPLDAKHPQALSYNQVEAFITSAPSLSEALENFGDVEYEGFGKVLNRAIKSYVGNDSSPLIMVLNNLSNDFYFDNPAQFNNVAFNILGYDSVIEHFQNESNICVWFKDDIKIISRESILKKEVENTFAKDKFDSASVSP